MSSRIEKLTNLLTRYHFNIDCISIEYLHDAMNILFNKGYPSKFLEDIDMFGNYSHQMGVCFYILGKNNLAEQYYLKAVNKMNYYAMYDLACFYHLNKQYDKMKELYIDAINFSNNTAAMNNLGFYYHKVKKNFTKALYYYNLAAKAKNPCAFNNLAYYYHYVEKKYNKSLAYYISAYRMGIDTCKKQINKVLELNFNFDFAYLNKDILNITNLRKLHLLIEQYCFQDITSFYIIIEGLKFLIISDKCHKCNNLAILYHLKCGHNVCAECKFRQCCCKNKIIFSNSSWQL